ncbi:hypothetical protein U0070_020316 [Myodes glareolus]|uniref:Uncharacterized protein n=1 Tax=Myodes glareolus TaxID=447135 RepID=A0AAW0HXP7_MYOGA
MASLGESPGLRGPVLVQEGRFLLTTGYACTWCNRRRALRGGASRKPVCSSRLLPELGATGSLESPVWKCNGR